MNLAAHLDKLNARHRELEREIEAETRHPAADDAHVATLKKLKLRLKDEIEALRGR